MFRNTSDIIDITKKVGPRKTLELLRKEYTKFQITDLTQYIDLYNVDNSHNIIDYLRPPFHKLNITSASVFSKLANEHAEIAVSLFNQYGTEIASLYRTDEDLKELAATYVLPYESLPSWTDSPKVQLSIRYQTFVRNRLVDFKTFLQMDKKNKQGNHYAELFISTILPSVDNFLDLLDLEPGTISRIFYLSRLSIINSAPSITMLMKLFTHISKTPLSNEGWNDLELWEVVSLFMKEEPTQAGSVFCEMVSQIPEFAMKLLKLYPAEMVPLIDRTHFLNLLDDAQGAKFAAEMLNQRPERIKELCLPIENFIELLEIDQKKQYPFLSIFLEKPEWINRFTTFLRSKDQFLDVVNADRYIAYSLLEKQPLAILKLFKELDQPKTPQNFTELRLAYINKIDELAEKRAQVKTSGLSDNNQTFFSGSQTSAVDKSTMVLKK